MIEDEILDTADFICTLRKRVPPHSGFRESWFDVDVPESGNCQFTVALFIYGSADYVLSLYIRETGERCEIGSNRYHFQHAVISKSDKKMNISRDEMKKKISNELIYNAILQMKQKVYKEIENICALLKTEIISYKRAAVRMEQNLEDCQKILAENIKV